MIAQEHLLITQSAPNNNRKVDTTDILSSISTTVHLHLMSPDSAQQILRQAIRHAQIARFRYGAYLAMYRLGDLYIHCGKNDSALQLHLQLKDLLQSSREKMLLAPVFNNLGIIYCNMGWYREGLDYYFQAEKAIVQHGTIDSITLGSILNNISIALLNIKETQQAFSYLKRAETIALHESNHRLLTRVLINTGIAYSIEKDYNNAEVYLKKALRQSKELKKNNSGLGSVEALTALGAFYVTNQQPDKGLQYLQQALVADSGINAKLRLNILGNIGVAWKQLGNFEKAITFHKKILESASKSSDLMRIASAYHELAYTYLAMKDYEKAFQYSWDYFNIKERVSGEKAKNEINHFNAKYQAALKNKIISDNQLQLSLQEKKLGKRNFLITFMSISSILFIILVIVIYRNLQQKKRAAEERILLLKKEQELVHLKAVMVGEETERTRVGRELHDGIGGMIAALKMRFSALRDDYELEEVNDFQEIMHILDETGVEVRQTAHNLMPEMLVRLGIGEALKQYVQWQQTVKHPKLSIDMRLQGNLDELPAAFQLALYRIVQELIKNVLQHAAAQHLLLQLNRNDNEVISLTAEDDGKGFEMNKETKGAGLKNIINRVHLYQGEIVIQSHTGEGTFVQIEFDFNKVNNLML